jgi:hypothetical protein
VIPLTTTVHGDFLAKMQERMAKWSGTKRIAARIEVPYELRWWYFHEYGTAPHRIPVGGAQSGVILVFPYGGVLQVRDEVNHPGVRARHMVGTVEPLIQDQLKAKVHALLTEYGANDPEKLREVVLESAEEAKKLIVESIAQNLPGDPGRAAQFPESPGKLGGQSAASVFEEQATVREL